MYYVYVYVHVQLCIRKNYKNGEFLVAIFDEIWPKTLYYSTGSLARFLSNFKNS